MDCAALYVKNSYTGRMLRILVEQTGEVIDDVLFDAKVVSIGRDLGNDVVLRDSRVSSTHVVLKQVGDSAHFRLIDQGWNATVVFADHAERNPVIDRPTVIRIADYEITLIPLERHESTAEVGRDDFQRTVEHQETPPMIPVRRTSSSRAEAEIRIVDGTGVERRIQLSETALIGRTRDCDVRIDSSDVSRQHCQIYYSGSGYLLRRLSTVNGVDVNGRPLALGEAIALRDGDVVTLCSFILTFHTPVRREKAVIEASPNLDLTVQRRPSIAPEAVAFDVVGFLGSKTFQKFEQNVLKAVQQHRDVILDLGYLVGVDAAGIASLARIFAEAQRRRTVVRVIRCTPRIVDLLHASTLSHEILPYVSRSEESAVKLLRR